MSQPLPAATLEDDNLPSSRMRRELQDTDSERTISPEPSNTSAPILGRASLPSSILEPNDKRVFIHVVGPETLHPITAHRDIFRSVKKIFPEAYKTFNDAPQHMKQMWFNEFKKIYKWESNDELRVREEEPTHMHGCWRLCWPNTVAFGTPRNSRKYVRKIRKTGTQIAEEWAHQNTREVPSPPENIEEECFVVVDQQEKKGEEPSRAEVYIKMRTKKSDKTFVCPKSKKVFETVTHLQQTQPELAEASIWLEAAGGVQKGGCVYGFRSDSQNYFPDFVRHKSRFGESSSQISYEDRFRRIEVELKKYERNICTMTSRLIVSSDPNAHTPRSNQGRGVGLDDINTTNEETPSPLNIDVGDDANSENIEG